MTWVAVVGVAQHASRMVAMTIIKILLPDGLDNLVERGMYVDGEVPSCCCSVDTERFGTDDDAFRQLAVAGGQLGVSVGLAVSVTVDMSVSAEVSDTRDKTGDGDTL